MANRKKKNEVNVFAEERELLCKQMKLLAERSANCHTAELANLSEQMVAIYLALAYGKTKKAKKTTPVWEQSVSVSLPDGIAERNPGDLVKKYCDNWKALMERAVRKSDV